MKKLLLVLVLACDTAAAIESDTVLQDGDSIKATAIEPSAAGEGIQLPGPLCTGTADTGTICYKPATDEVCVYDGAAWDCHPAAGSGGLPAATEDSVPVGNGTTFDAKVVPDCDAADKILRYDQATNAWSCGTLVDSYLLAFSTSVVAEVPTAGEAYVPWSTAFTAAGSCASGGYFFELDAAATLTKICARNLTINFDSDDVGTWKVRNVANTTTYATVVGRETGGDFGDNPDSVCVMPADTSYPANEDLCITTDSVAGSMAASGIISWAIYGYY